MYYKYTRLFIVSIILSQSLLLNSTPEIIDSIRSRKICPYDTVRDEEEIKRIASNHIARLVSTLAFSQNITCKELAENQVIPFCTNEEIIKHKLKIIKNSRVCLVNEKAIGFINYDIRYPWYRYFDPYGIGPNATIDHLAVDTAYHGCGHGAALLQDALNHCRDGGVNRVTLWTTAPNRELEKFYHRFGFGIVRITKLAEYQYALRLKPHPIQAISLKSVDLLRKIIRK